MIGADNVRCVEDTLDSRSVENPVLGAVRLLVVPIGNIFRLLGRPTGISPNVAYDLHYKYAQYAISRFLTLNGDNKLLFEAYVNACCVGRVFESSEKADEIKMAYSYALAARAAGRLKKVPGMQSFRVAQALAGYRTLQGFSECNERRGSNRMYHCAVNGVLGCIHGADFRKAGDELAGPVNVHDLRVIQGAIMEKVPWQEAITSIEITDFLFKKVRGIA